MIFPEQVLSKTQVSNFHGIFYRNQSFSIINTCNKKNYQLYIKVPTKFHGICQTCRRFSRVFRLAPFSRPFPVTLETQSILIEVNSHQHLLLQLRQHISTWIR